MSGFYCTSFCNFPHNVKTGSPVDHECYIIPPRLLKMERDGYDDNAKEAWGKWSDLGNRRRMVKGRPEKT